MNVQHKTAPKQGDVTVSLVWVDKLTKLVEHFRGFGDLKAGVPMSTLSSCDNNAAMSKAKLYLH